MVVAGLTQETRLIDIFLSFLYNVVFDFKLLSPTVATVEIATVARSLPPCKRQIKGWLSLHGSRRSHIVLTHPLTRLKLLSALLKTFPLPLPLLELLKKLLVSLPFDSFAHFFPLSLDRCSAFFIFMWWHQLRTGGICSFVIDGSYRY